MKYIVVELQTYNDGTVGNIVTAFDDRNSAENKYYLVMAAAAISELPSHAAILMTSEGLPLWHAVYHHGQLAG